MPRNRYRRGRRRRSGGRAHYRRTYRRPRKRPPPLAWVPNTFRGIQNDVMRLKNFINVEFKTLNTLVQTNYTPDDSGTRASLNNISQGDTSSSRHGDCIHMKSINLKFHLIANAANTYQVVRMMLIIDKNPGGALPGWTDVLESANVHALRNPAFKHRFAYLFDKKFMLVNGSASHSRIWHYYKDLNCKVTYDGNAGTVADLYANSLTLFLISDQAANTPTVNVTSRLRFVDN